MITVYYERTHSRNPYVRLVELFFTEDELNKWLKTHRYTIKNIRITGR